MRIKNTTLYTTLEEASSAAIKLGFTSAVEYRNNYKKDPKLPSTPNKQYHNWVNWGYFLGKPIKESYQSYLSAKSSVKKLNIKSIQEYRARYQEDPLLPSNPVLFYKNDWLNWTDYLDKSQIKKYKTYNQAKKAAKKLHIRNKSDYLNRYTKNPNLPRRPDAEYPLDWSGWHSFLETSNTIKFTSYAVASKAAQALEIKSSTDYEKKHKRDSRLYASPHKIYINWAGWDDFLGTVRFKKYETYQEAKSAALKLGVKTSKEYKNAYNKDPKLPSCPDYFYPSEWISWHSFLDIVTPSYYATCSEASSATQRLGIKSSIQYEKRYKEDPRLPGSPYLKYKGSWKGWRKFLNTESIYYQTYDEAKAAAQNLNIKKKSFYAKKYKKDSCLPYAPENQYKDEWVSWEDFLEIEQKYPTYSQAKQAAKRLGVKSSSEYFKNYKKDPKLIGTPNRYYRSEWKSWYDFLDSRIERYTYEEASQVARNLLFKNGHEYKNGYSIDPKLPSTPLSYYIEEWAGWNAFLGVEEKGPFIGAFDQFKNTSPEWHDATIKYISGERSQSVKVSSLRCFIADFIIPTGMSKSLSSILDSNNIFPIKEYKNFIKSLTRSVRSETHKICVNFLEWILEQHFSYESDVYELIRFPNFRNPIKSITSGLDLTVDSQRPHESVKPILPMSIIIRARNHLIPSESRFFSDIAHSHSFLQDCWFDIDPKSINKNDPDCVWRQKSVYRQKEKHKHKVVVTQMWSPVKLISLYTLLMVPLRGQQICWLDSGEADEEIPIIKEQNIIWIKNPLSISKKKTTQGFIKKYGHDQIGMHITTNKTGSVNYGYSVPYIPRELAYWVIRLRDWQQKYNPLKETTRWTEIKIKQHINKNVLMARGSQAFLFREPCYPGDKTSRSPIFPSTAFERSLPALLIEIQRPTEELAEKLPESRYKSPFTPHSLRTSLITAYIVEGGAPATTIMKLVGHSSLAMTIYYTKIGPSKMAAELAEAEKRALLESVDRLKDLSFSKNIEKARSELISTDKSIFSSIDDQWPIAAYQFSDWGLCPLSGSGCDTGGKLLAERAGSNIYGPVESGYLGKRNCPRCRYFITGPAWLGGLQALSNEIILEINSIRVEYHDLEGEKEELENKKFDTEVLGNSFKDNNKLNQTISTLEERALKLDLLLCDFQHVYNLISLCLSLLNNETSDEDPALNKKQLIISDSTSVKAVLSESESDFRLLVSICKDAEIYQATSSSRAGPKLSQMLDAFADRNDISPGLFKLSSKQQLKAANQISQVLLSRLNGNWDIAEDLIIGKINLDQLDSSSLIKVDIQDILIDSTTNFLENRNVKN